MVKLFLRLSVFTSTLLLIFHFAVSGQKPEEDNSSLRKSHKPTEKTAKTNHPGYAYQDPFRMPVAPLPDNSYFRMPIWVPDSSVTYHIANPLSNKGKILSVPDSNTPCPGNHSDSKQQDGFLKSPGGKKK